MPQEVIVVEGNNTLTGTVQVSGAKNSALKLMAASVLSDGICMLHNVPLISDINIMSEVLTCLGAHVCRNKDELYDEHTILIDTSSLSAYTTPYELVSKMRASISILGPLIGRFGQARVAMPGGCQIGARKIDMHLKGLEALGVIFDTDHGYLSATSPHGLTGAHVILDFPSVGATENMLMSSIVAKGKTIIENAAREPEIIDLADMLISMGAHIKNAGSSIIEVEGVKIEDLNPCAHTTVGDRIEAGTFLTGGALTGGALTVRGVNPAHLQMALIKFQELGCDIDTTDSSITILRNRDLLPIEIQTLPFPGFPTDLQAQFMLLTSFAKGTSLITENVFENRFMFASELARMGAHITIEDHHAIIKGIECLQGAPVSSTDLRAGAALVLAGVVAEGHTTIYNIEHIDRGYEDYVGKLKKLGAHISRTYID